MQTGTRAVDALHACGFKCRIQLSVAVIIGEVLHSGLEHPTLRAIKIKDKRVGTLGGCRREICATKTVVSDFHVL